MKQVIVNKAELLVILKKNKAEHREVFLEAQKKFREVVIEELDAQLKAARDGQPVMLERFTRLIQPQDYTAQYERAIRMLEMSVHTTVEINDREFQNFVEDVWDWSRDWAVSNSNYVNQNSRSYSKLHGILNE